MTTSPVPLGEITFEQPTFEGEDVVFESFKQDEFLSLTSQERFNFVCKKLLELLKSSSSRYCFRAFILFLERVSQEGILESKFNQTGFEYWLNNLSNLPYEKNRKIRAKIAGKYIPREAFQSVFPVGQGKAYPGSHTVTAHNPVDLDTLTASFWTWMDALACRVGTSLTVWNLPKGKPGPVISQLYDRMFPPAMFTRIAKHKTVITHVALDLLTQERLIKAKGHQSIHEFHKRRYESAVILVDDEGYYLGDWRPGDADLVGQVQRLLNRCFYLYEEFVIGTITQLFAKPLVKRPEVQLVLDEMFTRPVPELIHRHLTADELTLLDTYLKRVLDVEGGAQASVESWLQRMDEMAGSEFLPFKKNLEVFTDKDNFDSNDELDQDVDEIFTLFHNCYKHLTTSVLKARTYLDRLDIAMDIKQLVLGHKPQYITQRSEVEEIRKMMKSYRHVTVAFEGKDRRLTPLGIIHRDEIERPVQGTASVRDFFNPFEMKFSSHIEVISALDHHKSNVNSDAVMTINVADVQSSNTIMAELAFAINDKYGTRAQTPDSIHAQLEELRKGEISESSLNLQERLLRKQQALLHMDKGFYVDPQRELDEYLSYLNAIIDDTDLFAKMTWRDVNCVVELLNRIKSLQYQKEVIVLDISDIPMDRRNLKEAVKRILQDDDMFSFYSSLYTIKEDAVAESLTSINPEEPESSDVFADRKLQNAFNAVSQLKIFPNTVATFAKQRETLMLAWQELSNGTRRNNVTTDLFIHMNSTIRGAQEARNLTTDLGDLRDEIWISIDSDREEAVSHLRQFMVQFRNHPRFAEMDLKITVEGPDTPKHNFISNAVEDLWPQLTLCRSYDIALEFPVIIMHVKAGSLNSRKADITPFLPKINP